MGSVRILREAIGSSRIFISHGSYYGNRSNCISIASNNDNDNLYYEAKDLGIFDLLNVIGVLTGLIMITPDNICIKFITLLTTL